MYPSRLRVCVESSHRGGSTTTQRRCTYTQTHTSLPSRYFHAFSRMFALCESLLGRFRCRATLGPLYQPRASWLGLDRFPPISRFRNVVQVFYPKLFEFVAPMLKGVSLSSSPFRVYAHFIVSSNIAWRAQSDPGRRKQGLQIQARCSS
jgi:hypothetical protein